MPNDIEAQLDRLAEEATLRQVGRTRAIMNLIQGMGGEDTDTAKMFEEITVALAEEFRTGIQFAMANDQDVRDATLFRFWIDMAHREPGRVANALAYCIYPEDYRKALLGLISQPSKGSH